MTNQEKRHRGTGVKGSTAFPYGSTNYILFAVGLIMLVLGYAALSKGPWNSFWSLSIAPVLLVSSYCVIIPIAVLYQKKNKRQTDGTQQ